MIVGDIAGKGTIYDGSGKAIVGPDEALLDFFKAKSKSWVAENHKELKEVNFSGTQQLHFDGEFTITNKRILFLAEPRYFAEDTMSMGILGGSSEDFQHVVNRSNITKENKGKLYIQMEWQEIKKIRIGPVNSYIHLKVNGEQTFRFVIDKESGKRLKYIVDKMLNMK